MNEPTQPTYVKCFPCGGECHCQHPYHDAEEEARAYVINWFGGSWIIGKMEATS